MPSSFTVLDSQTLGNSFLFSHFSQSLIFSTPVIWPYQDHQHCFPLFSILPAFLSLWTCEYLTCKTHVCSHLRPAILVVTPAEEHWSLTQSKLSLCSEFGTCREGTNGCDGIFTVYSFIQTLNITLSYSLSRNHYSYFNFLPLFLGVLTCCFNYQF